MTLIFSVVFSDVGVAAAQDVFEVAVGAGRFVTLREIVLGRSSDFGDSAAEGLSVLIKRGVGHTPGSGGSTPTPASHTSHFFETTVTAAVNNTTPAEPGEGTLTTLRADAFNIHGGYQYLPVPEQSLVFFPGHACIVSISAPADSIWLSGTLVFEED